VISEFQSPTPAEVGPRKGKHMRRKLSHLMAPLLVAGTAAATIALAPTASAASNSTSCRDKGGATVCQRDGHSSIRVDPPTRANQPFGFNFGFGPMNPLWALG
jgi:hypothetical protein